MQIVRYLILIGFFIMSTTQSAYAFFTENYKRNNNYGVFKRKYSNDLYFSVAVGFIPKTFNLNLSNISLYDTNFTNSLTQNASNIAGKSLSDTYTYSLTFGIGYHSAKSGLRHEFQAEWYNLYAKPLTLGGEMVEYYLPNEIGLMTGENEGQEQTNATTATPKFTNATKLGDNYYIDLGSFSTHVNLTYNLYYNFQNIFKFWSTSWDVYLGAGIGWAIVNGGLYSTKYIVPTAITQENTNSATEEQTNTEQTTTIQNILYENNVSNFSTATNNKVIRKTFFAVAYHADIGVLANVSQSFAINLGLHFGATSRPLLTSNFKQISGTSTSGSHLEMHIALKVGMFLKALTFS